MASEKVTLISDSALSQSDAILEQVEALTNKKLKLDGPLTNGGKPGEEVEVSPEPAPFTSTADIYDEQSIEKLLNADLQVGFGEEQMSVMEKAAQRVAGGADSWTEKLASKSNLVEPLTLDIDDIRVDSSDSSAVMSAENLNINQADFNAAGTILNGGDEVIVRDGDYTNQVVGNDLPGTESEVDKILNADRNVADRNVIAEDYVVSGDQALSPQADVNVIGDSVKDTAATKVVSVQSQTNEKNSDIDSNNNNNAKLSTKSSRTGVRFSTTGSVVGSTITVSGDDSAGVEVAKVTSGMSAAKAATKVKELDSEARIVVSDGEGEEKISATKLSSNSNSSSTKVSAVKKDGIEKTDDGTSEVGRDSSAKVSAVKNTGKASSKGTISTIDDQSSVTSGTTKVNSSHATTTSAKVVANVAADPLSQASQLGGAAAAAAAGAGATKAEAKITNTTQGNKEAADKSDRELNTVAQNYGEGGNDDDQGRFAQETDYSSTQVDDGDQVGDQIPDEETFARLFEETATKANSSAGFSDISV